MSLQEQELIANYAAVRRRLMPKPPKPAPVVVPVTQAEPISQSVSVFYPPVNVVYLNPPLIRPEPVFGACPPVGEIIRIVAAFYQVPLIDILSERRTAHIVRPRQVAMYLARTLTTRSMPYIGQRIGDRDHTTVLYACRKLTKQLETDQRLKDEVDLCRMKISEFMAGRSF